MILKHLEGTSVTVVLIGLQTASRRWVQYEVEQSIRRDNGLLGIFIHHLNAPPNLLTRGLQIQTRLGLGLARGARPTAPSNVEFPAYDWDKDLVKFRLMIEAAGRRADALRARRTLGTLLGGKRTL